MSKATSSPTKIHTARGNTGIRVTALLDKVSLKALQSCQQSLSKPNGVTYSTTAIVRRALQHYRDKVASIKKNDQLLKDEAREVRLAAASIPANGIPHEGSE